MPNTDQDLQRQVIIDGRENGISFALFRNTIGKKIGLGITDFEGLDLVFFRGVTTPSELAQYTGLSSGSTTAMIDRLEKNGLVERRPHPTDRRGTLVVIVKETAERIAPLFMSARIAQSKLLASYSAHELEILSDYFKRSTAMFEAERKSLQASTSISAPISSVG